MIRSGGTHSACNVGRTTVLTRGEGYGTNRLGGYDDAAGDVTSRQQREGEEKSVSGLHRVFVEVEVASREKTRRQEKREGRARKV